MENWIQKYDGEMGEKQDEYEEIDEVYTKEKKQLHELEERFKTLEVGVHIFEHGFSFALYTSTIQRSQWNIY